MNAAFIMSNARALVKPFLLSQVSVSASMFFGDLACQYITRDHEKVVWWDRNRSRVMVLTGFCVSGPYTFTLMRVLEHYFPGKTSRAIFAKVVINGLQAPFGIAMAFTSIALLSGKTIESAQQKVINDVPRTWLTGALYWPIVSTLNMRFIPLDYRPLIGGSAGALWNIYISMMAYKTTPNKHDTTTSPTAIPVIDSVSGAGILLEPDSSLSTSAQSSSQVTVRPFTRRSVPLPLSVDENTTAVITE